MDIPILYEDDFLLVIDKPSGIVVNRAESVKEETIQDWVEKRYQISNTKYQKEEERNFFDRAGIVHRLDKETSGLLIIAKDPTSFSNIQSQFKNRIVLKKYITLVHGHVIPKVGEIKATVGRLPWNRERFGIIACGKEAATSYKVMAYYRHHPDFMSGSHRIPKQVQDANYSLLEVTPHTGRTHQIRIHLKYMGHSVVADKLYAGRKTYRNDLSFCKRLFLHARYLKFAHPRQGQYIEFICDLPSDLTQVTSNLRVGHYSYPHPEFRRHVGTKDLL